MLTVTITIRKQSFLLSVSIFQCFLFPSLYSFSFSFISSPYTILCQECLYGFNPCDAHNIVNRNLTDNIQCKFLSIISNVSGYSQKLDTSTWLLVAHGENTQCHVQCIIQSMYRTVFDLERYRIDSSAETWLVSPEASWGASSYNWRNPICSWTIGHVMIHLAVPLDQTRRRNCLRFPFVSPGVHAAAAAAVIHDERDLKIYPSKSIVLYTSIITGWMLINAAEAVILPLATASSSALMFIRPRIHHLPKVKWLRRHGNHWYLSSAKGWEKLYLHL